MIITLSFKSLISSSSYSFQPFKYSSTSTCPVGLSFKPLFTDISNSSSLNATEPPDPPNVKEGLIIAGKEIFSSKFVASSSDLTVYP